MTTAELDQTWVLYRQHHSLEVRNALIEHYLPWVHRVVHWLFPRVSDDWPLEQDDLVSHGVLGLMHSVEHYDPRQPARFETYCFPRIRGAIMDALRDLDSVSKETRKKLKHNGEDRPQTYSLHSRSFRGLLDDNGQDPVAHLEAQDTVRDLMKGFNRTERLIVILHYYEGLTKKEIGEQLGISAGRVSQIHLDLIHRLRERAAVVA